MGLTRRRAQITPLSATPAAALTRTGVLIAEAELTHHAGQAIGLLAQRFGSGGRLLDQRRVLLGHLVDLVHRLFTSPMTVDCSEAAAVISPMMSLTRCTPETISSMAEPASSTSFTPPSTALTLFLIKPLISLAA